MMHSIDRDIHSSCALVIDGNPTSRSILAAQLRDLGVGSVAQTGRIDDARQLLERRQFDIVLCDYHFEDSRMSGQDLLDELKREQLLPYATVFVMVTSEGSPAKVIEAAESALDGYLLKPHTAVGLAERVREARRRKTALKQIFEAMEMGEHALAAAECRRRYAAQGAYANYCARIGAELYLKLGQPAEAQALYDAVAATHGSPWAKVGVARAEWAAGQVEAARQTLETCIAESSDYADAYDVLGSIQAEQGEFKAAFDTYRRAALLTPGSITRLQRAGTLGFYVGAQAAALPALEIVAKLGARSKMFDAYVLALLGFLHFDAGDARGLQRAQDHLARLRERHPQALRLRRFDDLLRALRHLADKRTTDAAAIAAQLSAEVERPDMDIEAACNAIGLWSRLDAGGFAPDDWRSAVGEVASRYCTSTASTEMLVAAAHGNETVMMLVRDAQTAVAALAEPSAAAEQGDGGAARRSVQALIEHGGRTRNARLIDLAGTLAQRHLDALDDGEALLASVKELQQQYGTPGAPLLGRRPGARTNGALSLRTL